MAAWRRKPVEKYLFLAQVISSGSKSATNYMRIPARRADHENLNEFRRVPDIPWTEVDWKALHERIDACPRS